MAALPAFHTESSDGSSDQSVSQAVKAHKASCLRGAPLESALADVYGDATHIARQLLRSLDDLTDQLKVRLASPRIDSRILSLSIELASVVFRGVLLEVSLADVYGNATHLACQLLRSLDNLTDQLKVLFALPQSN